jgi:hypothetical protein
MIVTKSDWAGRKSGGSYEKVLKGSSSDVVFTHNCVILWRNNKRPNTDETV